jgi:hypothetical protein
MENKLIYYKATELWATELWATELWATELWATELWAKNQRVNLFVKYIEYQILMDTATKCK